MFALGVLIIRSSCLCMFASVSAYPFNAYVTCAFSHQVGEYADNLERVQFLLMWKYPFASSVILSMLIAFTLVTYYVNFRYLLIVVTTALLLSRLNELMSPERENQKPLNLFSRFATGKDAFANVASVPTACG